MTMNMYDQHPGYMFWPYLNFPLYTNAKGQGHLQGQLQGQDQANYGLGFHPALVASQIPALTSYCRSAAGAAASVDNHGRGDSSCRPLKAEKLELSPSNENLQQQLYQQQLLQQQHQQLLQTHHMIQVKNTSSIHHIIKINIFLKKKILFIDGN